MGAGVSTALGLPNTPSLIDAVVEFSKAKQWLQSERLPKRLEAAFRYFYPDAVNQGFKPDVVDFFSSLRTYLDIGAGLVGGFKDAANLDRSLRFAIAHLLIDRMHNAEPRMEAGHSFVDQIVQPGIIAITSNWDLLLERYAAMKGVPLRLSGTGRGHFVVLKLHGSVDWCLGRERDRTYPRTDFANLRELLFAPHQHRIGLPVHLDETPIRVRALEAPNQAWRLIRSRAEDLYMVTMAHGKAPQLGPLRDVWRDAYAALSRAREMVIVGYSMPPDDIEIRTLLRSGAIRGGRPPQIEVRNPAPDVHDRLRKYLAREVVSDYTPVPAT